MFKIQPNPTFQATVKIPVPGGKTEGLVLVFKHKTRDETADFFSRAASYKGKDAKLMLEIIDGWQGVDADFSEDALMRLLQNYHGATKAIFDAYLEELGQARAGN